MYMIFPGIMCGYAFDFPQEQGLDYDTFVSLSFLII